MAIEYEQVETAVEHMIGFSVALTGIIVLLAMIGLEVRKIDRQLAISVWLLAADAEWCLATAFLCVVDPGGGGTRPGETTVGTSAPGLLSFTSTSIRGSSRGFLTSL